MQNCSSKTTISRAGYSEHLKIISKQIIWEKRSGKSVLTWTWSVQFSWVMVFWKDKMTSEPPWERQNAACSKLQFNTPSYTLVSTVIEECVREHTGNLCVSYGTSRGMAEKHSLDEVIQTTIQAYATACQTKKFICNGSTQAMQALTQQ